MKAIKYLSLLGLILLTINCGDTNINSSNDYLNEFLKLKKPYTENADNIKLKPYDTNEEKYLKEHEEKYRIFNQFRFSIARPSKIQRLRV